MGTPDFAVPTLEALLASEFTVVGVVTKPDESIKKSGVSRWTLNPIDFEPLTLNLKTVVVRKKDTEDIDVPGEIKTFVVGA